MLGIIESYISLDQIIIIGLALLVGLAVLMLGLAARPLLRRFDPTHRRIRELSPEEEIRSGMGAKPEASLRKRIIDLLKKIAPAKEKEDKSSWEQNRLRKELVAAGFRAPEALSIFIGLKIVLVLGLPLVTFSMTMAAGLQPVLVLMLTFAGAVVGFIGPSYTLEKMSTSRGEKIVKELPSVLDLLVIAVEAGLGLDAAIKRVTRELFYSCPIMANELTMLTLELKLGVAREQALRNMAGRTGVDEVSSLVTMLIQADRFGVSIARSIRVYSDEMRTKRRQLAEEKAAKIPLKLLFPVLFMIFPAIMAVMAGPAVINIMENMF